MVTGYGRLDQSFPQRIEFMRERYTAEQYRWEVLRNAAGISLASPQIYTKSRNMLAAGIAGSRFSYLGIIVPKSSNPTYKGRHGMQSLRGLPMHAGATTLWSLIIGDKSLREGVSFV
jgi:hypothetical protein